MGTVQSGGKYLHWNEADQVAAAPASETQAVGATTQPKGILKASKAAAPSMNPDKSVLSQSMGREFQMKPSTPNQRRPSSPGDLLRFKSWEKAYPKT